MKFEKLLHILTENSTQEDTITLNQLYDGEYPPSNEMIWNYIGTGDFDTPMFVETISPQEIMEIFKSQYQISNKTQLNKLLSREQKSIVKSFMNMRGLSDEIIVISDGVVVDGNHRALAALSKNVPIKYVNLADI